MRYRANSIAVIICGYTEERWHDLIAAIASVQQQHVPPTEIIVVIDHNSRLFKRIQERFLDVSVVENTEARGLSGARNSGIRAAGSQIIAFLDDDAVATPDWLMLLSQRLDDPQVLGVGGAVKPLWLADVPGWLPEEFYWVVGCSYRGMPQIATAIRNPIGANMAFKRKVFDAVGGFRHGIGRVGKFPVGCEETELCIRAGQHWPQHTFLYQPEARVFHRVPGNRANFRYFCSRCYAEGLSKAVVSRYVGVQDSLSSERGYTLRVLPQAVLRGIRDGLFRADTSGFQRAGTVVLGLVVTMMGYLVGSVAGCPIPREGIKKSTRLELQTAASTNSK